MCVKSTQGRVQDVLGESWIAAWTLISRELAQRGLPPSRISYSYTSIAKLVIVSPTRFRSRPQFFLHQLRLNL